MRLRNQRQYDGTPIAPKVFATSSLDDLMKCRTDRLDARANNVDVVSLGQVFKNARSEHESRWSDLRFDLAERDHARVWIGIIALVSTTACALALLIATLGAFAGVASGETESSQTAPPSSVQRRTYEGMITDAHCGAKHSADMGKTAADCTRACVHGGERFALVDNEAAYLLDGDLVALKRAAGQRVRILGTLNGNTISVASVSAPS